MNMRSIFILVARRKENFFLWFFRQRKFSGIENFSSTFFLNLNSIQSIMLLILLLNFLFFFLCSEGKGDFSDFFFQGMKNTFVWLFIVLRWMGRMKNVLWIDFHFWSGVFPSEFSLGTQSNFNYPLNTPLNLLPSCCFFYRFLLFSIFISICQENFPIFPKTIFSFFFFCVCVLCVCLHYLFNARILKKKT